jgi:hypothetical protein
MKFLIATNNTAFLNEATSIIETKLPQIKHVQDVLDQSDLLKKITKTKFDYILIDINSCPIDIPFFTKIATLKGTKVKIAGQNHADFPGEFFNQTSIQLFNMNYQLMTQELKKFILNDKDFFWGKDIKQLTLYKKEILCHEGLVGDAIYLIKEGLLKREFPDGSILDKSIGSGKIIGELGYFNREPRKWNIVAVENCTLVRITYNKVDKQLENQPTWIKVMLKTLAERNLRYAKPS